MDLKNISFTNIHLDWSNHLFSSMDRFAFFIILVALASVFFLILAFTLLHRDAATFVLSVGLALVAIVGLIIYCVRRKPKNRGEDLMRFDLELSLKTGNIELTETNDAGRSRKKDAVIPLFSFSSVSAATNNFSPTYKLGEGGFGPVYKGVLLKGEEVAVKRLSGKSGQGFEELKNEATVIAKVQHKNLVRLLGCCIERDEKILIYEYMPNKSLDFFLFDPIKSTLDWETRVRIIEGISQGLLYLHEYSRLRIIHRDLKASNILLDKEMNPKISDFGMARIMFGGNELQAKTTRIAGTYGYISPEYAIGGVFSTKSDVFSFGVLLLEILSSKKNVGFYQTESLNLLDHAWDLWTSDRVSDLIDAEMLKEAYSIRTISRYVNIALLCVQEIAEDRPTMSDVFSMLTNEAVPLLPPKLPAFSHLRNAVSPTSRPGKNSINEVTVSILEAR